MFVYTEKAAFAKVSVKASAEKFVEEERPPPPGEVAMVTGVGYNYYSVGVSFCTGQQKQVLTTINFSMASTEVLDHGELASTACGHSLPQFAMNMT